MPATAPPAPVDPAAWPPYVLALKERIAYLPPAQVTLVLRAYAVGAQAHAGQERKSGEPYITHPVAVASILAELGLDAETIIAAILHDTLEDTELSREELA
jgi:guanosine-3',5'-bis(diphosphate) 3'-pyrophosphohydrolase